MNQSSRIDNGSTTYQYSRELPPSPPESVSLSLLLPFDGYTPKTNKSSSNCLDGLDCLDVSIELDDSRS